MGRPAQGSRGSPSHVSTRRRRQSAPADGGQKLRLIPGAAYGARAPIQTAARLFYINALLQPGAKLPLPDNHEDRGTDVVEGSINVAGDTFGAGRMMVLRPGNSLPVTAGGWGARLMLPGGDTFAGPRHIWWNFGA